MMLSYGPALPEDAGTLFRLNKELIDQYETVQDIPYEDASFDLIIANAMLYHVPDLDRALREVARVLKPEGRFICSTTGENSLHTWLLQVLGAGESPSLPFTLQNGAPPLAQHFESVEMILREDALEVTDTNDLVAYIHSMSSFSFVKEYRQDTLAALLDARAVNGAIHIPKEYGLFVCSLPKKP